MVEITDFKKKKLQGLITSQPPQPPRPVRRAPPQAQPPPQREEPRPQIQPPPQREEPRPQPRPQPQPAVDQRLLEALLDHLRDMSENLRSLTAQQEEMTVHLKRMDDTLASQAVQPTITGMYYNKPETPIQVATPVEPQDTDQLSNPATGAPGYQREAVWEALRRLSRRLTVINDGTVDLFAIVSPDQKKWSLEAPIRVGEARTFFDVYELRIRAAQVGDITTAVGNVFLGGVYRITEYDFWLAYTTPSVTINRSSFIIQTVNAPVAGTLLPSINVPGGFRLVIRATVGNTGQVFVANSIANATTAGVPGNRATLNPGDAVELSILNASSVAIAGSAAGQNVDIITEQ